MASRPRPAADVKPAAFEAFGSTTAQLKLFAMDEDSIKLFLILAQVGIILFILPGKRWCPCEFQVVASLPQACLPSHPHQPLFSTKDSRPLHAQPSLLSCHEWSPHVPRTFHRWGVGVSPCWVASGRIENYALAFGCP